MTEFWPNAWHVHDVLRGQGELDDETVLGLRDLAVQRYVFIFRQFADARWFDQLRAVGLFSEPPAVRRDGETITADGWPIMAYLTAVAPELPDGVAEVLESLRTDNWWVIANAIETAAHLPATTAEGAILGVLRQWHSSSLHWTDPDALVAVLERLAEQPEPSGLTEAVFRITSRIWETRGVGYDVNEVLDPVTARLPSEKHGSVADGIELAMQHHALTAAEWSRFGVSLADLDRDLDDPVSTLLTAWLRIVEAEAKRTGASRALQRCLRLLGAEHRVVTEMGLRALRIALDRSAGDPTARGVLEGLAHRSAVLLDYQLEGEVLPLFAAHWSVLSLATRAAWIDELLRIGSQDEEAGPDRYAVRDWLGHLRAHLGDRELLLLERLEQELGPARMDFTGPRATGMFVGPVGPLSSDEISNLSPEDLLGLMRFVPGRGDDMFGPTPEGLGRQVRAEVARRPAEFVPLLDQIAQTVPYASVVHNVMWGLTEAFKSEDTRSPEARSAVIDFMLKAIERADGGLYEAEPHYGASQIVKGAADLLEDLASWMADAPEHDAIVRVLERILGDSEPAPEFEDRFGDENMDPPTLSLNTIRGRGVRAALALLSRSWNTDRESSLRERIEQILTTHVRSEPSPAVFSSFGFWLPQLVVYWRSFWAEHEATLLPRDREHSARWEAVFTTYLMFSRPHVRLAAELQEHYRLATERASQPQFPFLQKHGSRLLVHLAAVGLRPEDAPKGWNELVRQAVASLQSDQVGRAAAELAHALRDEALDVSTDWLLDFVKVRLIARRGQPFDRTEGRALGDLTFASRAPLAQSGGLLLDLAKRVPSLDGDRLLEYLRDVDAPRTRLGAAVLEAAIEAKQYQGFVRSRELMNGLLQEYAAIDPARGWAMVNVLGAEGIFDIEDLARSIYESGRLDGLQPST